MSSEFPGLGAEGDIYPSRIIKIGTAGDSALQAGSNQLGIGIATDAQKAPATTSGGVAAASGDSINWYGPGDVCLVECAGNISPGGKFISDTDGKAVAIGSTAATVYNVIGFMLENGASGRLARCIVWPHAHTTPA